MTGGDQHARAEASFSALIEGDLPAPEAAWLEAHLSTCIQCRTHLQRFRSTVGSLGKLKTRAPSTFLGDIERLINQRSRGRFFRTRWLLFGRVPFEWASMATILAMLIYYIVTLQGAPTGVSPAP